MQIDEFVQRRAFADVARWREQGFENLRLSVNLSAQQLEQDRLRRIGSLAMFRWPDSSRKPQAGDHRKHPDAGYGNHHSQAPGAAAQGARIAIDDFGTGYSSLSYLQQFPIQTLKIDRCFVCDIRAEEGDASIINAIVAMARGLKLDLIAEGVENRTQLRYLQGPGVSRSAGFLLQSTGTGAADD